MIDSYYASYPFEYYEIGKVYSFYARKNTVYKIADEANVKKYAKKLKGIPLDTDKYPENRFSGFCQRACAVVVDKIRGDGSNEKIRVMFQGVDEDGKIIYVEKLYVVNYAGIETDGWEAMPVSPVLYNINVDKDDYKSQTSGKKSVSGGELSKKTTDSSLDKKVSRPIEVETGITVDEETGVTVDEETGVTVDEETGVTADEETGVTVDE